MQTCFWIAARALILGPHYYMKAPQVLPKLYATSGRIYSLILHAENGEKEWEMIDMIVAKSSKSITIIINGVFSTLAATNS